MLYEFHNCVFSRQVSNRELFVKILSLAIVMEIAVFPLS